MATVTPPSATSTVRPVNESLIVPPEDTVWVKYSPHFEAPLSFVGSGALHTLVLGLVLGIGLVMYVSGAFTPRPLPIDTIRMGGGGGNKKGSGSGPGIGALPGEDVPSGKTTP